MFVPLLLAFAFIFLTSCDSLKDSIGLGRNQPDEFKTPVNPPLSVPKDLSLPPPKSESEAITPEKKTSKVQDVLFKRETQPKNPLNFPESPPSSGQLTPNIRAILNAEAKEKSS